ncbi:MAG: ABC transporter permease subunit [Pseudomonadota bacterium]
MGVPHGVWDAKSLEECRRIVTTLYGDGAGGACWAVLKDNTSYLLFGFYPPTEHWRPALAAGLLVLAVVPVLTRSAPRKLLWFSAVYPFIAYVLIWGGLGLEVVSHHRFGGIMLTVLLGTIGSAAAIFVGVALALGRMFLILPGRALCAAIIEVFRGVPVFVVLFAGSINLTYALPPGTQVDLISWVVLVIALCSGAHIAAAIADGLAAIPEGQRDAARALGLSTSGAFFLVVLPQAIRSVGPRIALACAGTFRDTSLVLVVGLLDPIALSGVFRAQASWNGIFWELYLVVGLLYGLICFSVTCYAKHLQRRLDWEDANPISALERTRTRSIALDSVS